MLEPVL